MGVKHITCPVCKGQYSEERTSECCDGRGWIEVHETTDQKLDRIIELLESFKVPIVIHVTNPPNPIWHEDKVGWPISPGPTCECNHEARELIHPDFGPNITYTSSYNETPQRFWNERGVEIMPGTEQYKICKAICESKEK